MASLDQKSSSTQPTKVVEFGTRHSAFQPVRPRISKESTPWLPTGARRGGPLMGPPPSPVLAPLGPPARARSEERSSESENESSLSSPSSSTHSPRLPQLSWGQQRDEYLALSIGLGAVEI